MKYLKNVDKWNLPINQSCYCTGVGRGIFCMFGSFLGWFVKILQAQFICRGRWRICAKIHHINNFNTLWVPLPWGLVTNSIWYIKLIDWPNFMAESTIACVRAISSQKIATKRDTVASSDNKTLPRLHLDHLNISLFLMNERTSKLLTRILFVIP